MICPNSTESGCRCPDHAIGLAGYSRDPIAYQAALSRCQPKTILTVLTRDDPPPQPVVYTDTPRKIPQPWEPKPSRRLRVA